MDLEISISKQADVFKQHLDDKNNERIIFSGIFGIGKSYFLKKYFEERPEQYITINLKPVNYSISSNDDIFRLIKYDILYELIFTHNLELIFESTTRSIAYGIALDENLPSLLEAFLPVIPLLNKETSDISPLVGLINKIIPTFKEAEETRKDLNLNQRLLDFVKEIERTQVLESDFITSFIEKSLSSFLITESTDEKTKVLIIDDLDRIDPEHIFRLFNIFSAHLDYHKTSSNKFGFDKIIFVCDIQNIRNIFSTKYGMNVDFSGYIDKFFSTEIFYYDNSEEVAAVTDKIIDSIDFGGYKWFFERYLLNSQNPGLLVFLIKECINSGALSIRRIKAIFAAKFKYHERYLNFAVLQSVQNLHLPAVISLEVLVWVFGSVEALDKALQKLVRYGKSKDNGYSNDQITKERFAGYFITILGHKEHKFEASYSSQANSGTVHQLNIDENIVEYQLAKYIDRNEQYYGNIKSVNGKKDINPNLYLYDIIYQSFKTLLDINYL